MCVVKVKRCLKNNYLTILITVSTVTTTFNPVIRLWSHNVLDWWCRWCCWMVRGMSCSDDVSCPLQSRKEVLSWCGRASVGGGASVVALWPHLRENVYRLKLKVLRCFMAKITPFSSRVTEWSFFQMLWSLSPCKTYKNTTFWKWGFCRMRTIAASPVFTNLWTGNGFYSVLISCNQVSVITVIQLSNWLLASHNLIILTWEVRLVDSLVCAERPSRDAGNRNANNHLLQARHAEQHLWMRNTLNMDGLQQQKSHTGCPSCLLTVTWRCN